MSGRHEPEVLERSIAKTRQWIEDVMGVLPAQVPGPLEPAVR